MLQGHDGKFSVYVHASKDKPAHVSRYFVNRDIRSDQVRLILCQSGWLYVVG